MTENIKKKAQESGFDFEIVSADDHEQETVYRIADANYQFNTTLIAYCEQIEHIIFCLKYCKQQCITFRIRSNASLYDLPMVDADLLIIDLSRYSVHAVFNRWMDFDAAQHLASITEHHQKLQVVDKKPGPLPHDH